MTSGSKRVGLKVRWRLVGLVVLLGSVGLLVTAFWRPDTLLGPSQPTPTPTPPATPHLAPEVILRPLPAPGPRYLPLLTRNAWQAPPAPPATLAPPTATLPPTATPEIPPPTAVFRQAEAVVAHASCHLTMFMGTIRRADGATLDGVQVRVWWEGAPSEQALSFPSGPGGYPGHPHGYWDYFLADHPVANTWFVQVVDGVSGAGLSSIVRVETDATPCEPGSGGRQLVILDWLLIEGEYGIPGPTVTPTAPPPPTEIPPPLPSATPLLVPDGAYRVVKVPILMYHYLSAPPPDADRFRVDLSVAPETFREHLTLLRDNGFTTITLRELGYALAMGWPLPERPIVLTFDDGYVDNYTYAYPLLREFGMRATFFVVTNPPEERNLSYMYWENLLEMHQGGMEIGSHTLGHPSLPGKPEAFIWDEVRGSYELLTQRLGVPPVSFAYPSGHYDDGVVHLVHAAGYQVAVVTEQGATHTSGNLLTLKRIRVRGSYGAAELANVISYWMNSD